MGVSLSDTIGAWWLDRPAVEPLERLRRHRLTSHLDDLEDDEREFDLYENDDGFVVEVDLQGYDPKDISVVVDERSVTFDATRTSEDEVDVSDESSPTSIPIFDPTTVVLPCEVVTEGSIASFEHGTLTVFLPRKGDVAECRPESGK